MEEYLIKSKTGYSLKLSKGQIIKVIDRKDNKLLTLLHTMKKILRKDLTQLQQGMLYSPLILKKTTNYIPIYIDLC